MVEVEERELLLQSLKAYLEELRESGVDELTFAQPPLSNQPLQDLPAGTRPGASGGAGQGVSGGAGQGAEATVPVSQGGEDSCQGVGNPRARLLFVMDGAGFAGAAGELLANIVKAMKFDTSDVHLLSFPAGSGSAASPSREQLMRRIEAVGPEVVVTLGDKSAQILLETGEPVAKLRGRFHDLGGISLMATLHPEALVADPTLKRDVWNEMQQVMRRLSQPR